MPCRGFVCLFPSPPLLECQLLEGSDLCICVHPVPSAMLASSRYFINTVTLMNQRRNVSTLAACPQHSSRPGMANSGVCSCTPPPPAAPSLGCSSRRYKQSSLLYLLPVFVQMSLSLRPPPTFLL